MNDVTAVVVNYKTKAETERCVQSWLNHYPQTPLILIDNGSDDESTEYIRQVGVRETAVTAYLNPDNRYHGPALDQGIQFSSTRFVFTLDSDCEIRQRGFLEQMVAQFKQPDLYALGDKVIMDRYGYAAHPRARHQIPYILPYAMLLDTHKYRQLKPPFEHHGSPCLGNMAAAMKAGYVVQAFDIAAYVYHEGMVTCSRYGYGLSVRTSIEKILHQLNLFT